MSVIPLSVAEQRGDMQTTSSHDSGPTPDDYNAEQREKSDRAFDESFEKAYRPAIEREREAEANRAGGRGKSLDQLIDGAQAQSAAKQAARDAWERAREPFRKIHERYGEDGATPTKTVGSILAWSRGFRAAPEQAGEAFTRHYAARSPYALLGKEPGKEITPSKAEYTNGMDRAISAAIDGVGYWDEFEATAALQAEHAKEFPGVPLDQTIRRFERIDRDGHLDPAGVGGTLAAAYGMPITRSQQQEAHENAVAQQAIGQGLQTIPALRDRQVQQTAALHVLNSPYFRSSNNPVQDLANAADIAQQIHRNGHLPLFERVHSPAFNAHRSGDLNRDLAVAASHLQQEHAQTMAAIPGQIAAFERKHLDLPEYRTDMAILLASGRAQDLPGAYRMAKQNRQAQAAAVDRARRAAPLRHSVGNGSAQHAHGLDAIIGAAIAPHFS